MAQYHFDMPEGWVGVPLSSSQGGVHLRPEAPQGPRTRAVIVLLGPVPAVGTARDTLEQMVEEGSAGAEIVRRGEMLPFRSVAYPGLLTAVRLRLPDGQGTASPGVEEEGRIFAVLDAGAERIPVVFAGGPEALPLHKGALDLVLSSLRPHLGGPSGPLAGWTD